VTMDASQLVTRLAMLNAEYARCIDADALESWPGFFSDPCLYTITSRANHARGRPVGIVYADSQAMLKDRVASLRQANIYEAQRYRHIIGLPCVTGQQPAQASAETPFALYRITRDARSDLFATGCYMDKVEIAPDGRLALAERVVVCDSSVFDTLVAIPF
jgi:3-phenylpropionate/cinnamic acid dioxygenase small subunit